jgi:glycosyltransferase involved in cell wall biosynthesis
LNEGWYIDIITRNLGEEWKTYNYGSEMIQPWLPLSNNTYIVRYEHGEKSKRVLETLISFLVIRHPVDGCRWAMHAVKIGLKLHKVNNYDLIISRSLPDAAHMAAMKFSQITGIPWIANWNDPSGDKHPIPYGKGPYGALSYFYSRMLKAVAKNASWHTLPSERMRQYISIYLGDNIRKKSSVIPHVAIKYFNQPLTSRDRNIFTITHAGYISKERNPELLFQAIKLLVDQYKIYNKIKLKFIGIDYIGLNKLFLQYGLNNIAECYPPMNYLETQKILIDSDVLLILEAPSEEGIYLPAKFVDYVQTGRPILAITPKHSTLKDIISQNGGGLAVDCLSVEEILSALQKFFRYWEDRALENRYSSVNLYHIFSHETIITAYEDIFIRLGIQKNKE